MKLFKGVGAAMVTPFGNDGNIDYKVLDKYIEHLLSGGVSALLPFGTTGELPNITADEYAEGLKFIVKKVGGRVPVIVGAGSNSTKKAYKQACVAKDCGANGVLVVTPYYNKCTQLGIVEHYREVAKAELPIITYNVPSRTGVNIAPGTLAKLATVKGVVGIKEASGNIATFQAVAKVCAETGLALYSGNDELTAVGMALGCSGVISVAASPAPEYVNKLCELCFANDYKAARELQFKLDEFIAALFCEVNPIPVKKAMQLLGFGVGAPRLPLTELEPEHMERLKCAMKEIGLLK